jgi:hypothetical protein
MPSHMPVRGDYLHVLGIVGMNAIRKAPSIGGPSSFTRSIRAQRDGVLTNHANWGSQRCSHFTNDDIDYFQSKIAEMLEKWQVLCVLPLRKDVESLRNRL